MAARNGVALALSSLLLAGASALAGMPEPDWDLRDAAREETAARERICLNGVWQFHLGDREVTQEGWAAMKVPSRVDPAEFDVWLADGTKYEGNALDMPKTAWYRRMLRVPAEWRGSRVMLDVGHVQKRGDVHFNGEPVGHGDSVIDVTDLVRWGAEDELAIYAFSTREGSEWWMEIDWSQGIYGDVWLERRASPVNVAAVRIITSVADGRLTADVDVENAGDAGAAVRAWAVVLDWPGPGGEALELPGRELSVPAGGQGSVRLSAAWDSPKLWTPDTPHLYVLVTRLTDPSGRVLDETRERFGFRQVECRDGGYLLNGRPVHLRFETAFSWEDGGLYSSRNKERLVAFLKYLKGMGYNGVGAAASQWAGRERLAEACDEVGMFWVPGWEAASPENIRLLFNHPSVIAWSTDTWKTLHTWVCQPGKMGEDYFPAWLEGRREEMLAHEEHIRALDPTRLIIHYGDGNVGATWCNLPYLGFGVPLQEREDWPSAWSARRRVALFCAELCFPFSFSWSDVDARDANVYGWGEKDKMSLHLEHGARYLGEAAYGMSERLLADSFNCRDADGDPARVVREVSARFIRGTFRSWRTYGVSCIGAFGITGGGYGHLVSSFSGRAQPQPAWGNLKTPGPKSDRCFEPAPMEKPNEVYQVTRDAWSPVLVYVGGHPDFSLKDHAYFAGETVRKQVVVVNDLFEDATVRVDWECVSGDRRIAGGSENIPVGAGTVAFREVSFRAPDVGERTEAEIRLRPECDAVEMAQDAFALQFFPVERAGAVQGVALLDSQGGAARMLERAGVSAHRVATAAEAAGSRMLVIGRGSLTPDVDAGDLLPAVRDGLNVLCLEQTPDGLLGGVLDDTYERYTFAAAPGHPALEGLAPADLVNWRGESDFCEPYPEPAPETERAYPEEFWHWGNRGIVSTYVMRKPHLGNARAVLSCGFDMESAPLVEAFEGRGTVVFCQLDVTSRYGSDPAATRIVDNLLRYLARPAPAAKAVAVIGDDGAREALELLGYEHKPAGDPAALSPDDTVLVVGDAAAALPQKAAVERFVRAGGLCISLAGAAGDWLPFPVSAAPTKVGRTLLPGRHPLLEGLGAGDFYWRRPYDVTAVQPRADGVFVLDTGVLAVVPFGEGRCVLCQVDPLQFREEREDLDRAFTVAYQKSLRVLNALLLNAGARSAERLSLVPTSRTVEWVPIVTEDFEDGQAQGWQSVSGPWRVEDGRLHKQVGGPGRSAFVYERALKDYRIEFDTRGEAEKSPIVLLDFQDAENHFFIQLSQDGLRMADISQGQWRKSLVGGAEGDPVVVLDDERWHRVVAEVVGTTVELYVDGRRALQLGGLPRKQRVQGGVAYSDGRVGLGSYGHPVWFDNVVVSVPQAAVASLDGFEPSPLYRCVSDRWGYNPNKYRQW